jgi:hypothetical protein
MSPGVAAVVVLEDLPVATVNCLLEQRVGHGCQIYGLSIAVKINDDLPGILFRVFNFAQGYGLTEKFGIGQGDYVV